MFDIWTDRGEMMPKYQSTYGKSKYDLKFIGLIGNV